MKYLLKNTPNTLPFPEGDYRPNFFIDLYQELLSTDVPISYQPQIMNIFGYADEIIEAIMYYEKHNSSKKRIYRILCEFFEHIESDDIAKDVYKNEVPMLKDLFSPNTQDCLTNSNIIKIKLLVKIIMSNKKKEEYWVKMKGSLISSLCETADLSHKRRVLDNIHNITTLFISHSLNTFGTVKYLFNRCEQFTRKGNYRNRSWEQQIKKILGDFSTSKKDFFVCFLALSKSEIEGNEKILTQKQFMEENDFSEKYTKKFLGQLDSLNTSSKNKEYIIKYKTTAYNYDHALINTKEEQLHMDLISILHDIRILPKALVFYKNNNLTHCNIIDTEESLNRKIFLELKEIDLSHSLKILNHESYNLLKNSLRHFRICKQSKSLEQRFLNCWIALETIYLRQKPLDEENKILDNITYYIPMIYNSFSIIRKIRYAKELLVANKIPVPDELYSKISSSNNLFNEENTMQEIWTIMRDKGLFETLMRNINGFEHLKYRLTSIHNFVINKDSKSNKTKKIKKSFEKSERAVINQLHRIYGLRNKISHQGHYQNINPQMVEHLMDYLMISYSAIAIGSKLILEVSDDENYSLLDILELYSLQFSKIMTNIDSDNISDLGSIVVYKN